MEKLKPYPKYKPVNLPWLKEIPAHWECKKIRAYFSERRKKVSDQDFAPLSVTKQGVVPQLETACKTNDGDNRKLVLSGDFVINSRSDRKGSSGISYIDGSVSLINIVLEPRNIHGPYINYLLRSNDFIEEFYRNGRGLVADLWTTRYQEMRNIFIPIPRLDEQKKIVAFLDEKTAKIDKYIEAKSKEIELLKEQKNAEISNAVTRGLNPNTKFKPVNLPWLKEIPAHWECKKIRAYFSERRKKVSDQDFAPLSVTKQGVVPQLETACKTNDGDNRKLVLSGDFVINSRSDRKGSSGISYIDGSVSLINIVLEPRNIHGPYINYLLRSNDFIEEFYRNGRGLVADLWTTRYQEMRNIFIPIPQLDEQKKIVAFLDDKTEKYTKAISAIQRKIDLLKEYKTRLISDAVTGKIRV